VNKLHVEASGTTKAPPAAVWALLADTNAYTHWGIWDAADVDAVGTNGLVGLVRRLRLGRTTTVERIVEAEEPVRMTYTVVAGIPVRNYLAEVVLTPGGDGGTTVRWVADWDRTLLGRVVHRKLRTLYPEIMQRLVAAADAAVARPS
jgi:uncharacterized protein YndB with AHSA1/START domain